MSANGSRTKQRSLRRRAVPWVTTGLLLVAVPASAAWWRGRRPAEYTTAKVTKGEIRRTVGMTGALNPVTTVQVGSYVSGTIHSLGCDYNTEVVVGQVCATIDPVPFQLIVDQDQAALATAEAQLEKDQAALEYAKIALQRDTKLRADGSVSQDALDNDRNVHDQAVAQVGLDQAGIDEKKAALKAARVNLAYTRIVSPVVGTVITRAIDVGQTVAASLQSPTLFLIGKDLTHMQVDTNVSEADVGGVKEGQDAFFTVQAFPGETFQGKVRQVRRGPITVQNVVTYDVVVAVDNPDRKLFPGMTADTHIVLEQHDDVLKVPLPATRFVPAGSGRAHGGPGGASRGGNAREHEERAAGGDRPAGRPDGRGDRPGEHRGHLWVLRDGQLRSILVVTGIDDGTLIEVRGDGLEEGDTVVVNMANVESARAGASQAPSLLRPPGPRL